MSISIGIAAALDGDKNVEQILERADRALSRAKTAGGNRFALASAN